MTLKNNFKKLPVPILVLFLVFLLTPFATLFFIDPWELSTREGVGKAILVLATYGIFPLCLCYSLTVKHFLFLPLYIAQCGFLIVHSYVFSNAMTVDVLAARYALVGLMFYIGILVGNKDFLYPFLTRAERFWRKAKRVSVSYQIHLHGEGVGQKIPALIENCSESGMAVAVEPRLVSSFLKERSEGDTVRASLRWPGKEMNVSLKLIWRKSTGEKYSFGFRFEEAGPMRDFMEWVHAELEYESRFYRRLTPSALELNLSQTGFTLWIIFVLLSFGLPVVAIL